MLESTNALIGALAAVIREMKRCQNELDSGLLAEQAEEDLGVFAEQLHEAYADLAAEYEARLSLHAGLLDVDALRRHFES
ncbi:hypothetical protein PY254_00020 [Rhodanobacter sp. AS-Z3]|uniref:hypothetical protein n=1 Tax=Rhodanobacter sp. AS-Z3 TaxID=3031330 RepID=UPI00247A9AB3|nr:hypothetical protein [Rhodanobacter sp. AS-Z3]WEN15107.1 hypothetical protein PY254_00020 [Rhodanobacter sp. AS-Z3]